MQRFLDRLKNLNFVSVLLIAAITIVVVSFLRLLLIGIGVIPSVENNPDSQNPGGGSSQIPLPDSARLRYENYRYNYDYDESLPEDARYLPTESLDATLPFIGNGFTVSKTATGYRVEYLPSEGDGNLQNGLIYLRNYGVGIYTYNVELVENPRL